MADGFNMPQDPNKVPRFAGFATMMRLPVHQSAAGLDACFLGAPMDIGTSNRSGTRLGPRAIRDASVLIRPYNTATGAAPFESLRVADIGDVATNPYDLRDSVRRIEAHLDGVLAHDCCPLVLGGDHTITLPVLRAVAKKHGPVGMVHADAHADVNDAMFGETIAHGTPFRRAVEEGLLDGKRVVQIGLRGGGYGPDEFDWTRAQGFRTVRAEECWHRSLLPLMEGVRVQLGSGPVYISFDIDALDPAFAPGTGTPEVGGLTVAQGMEILRGCRGLEIVGGDLVEVAPSYDPAAVTALAAANLLYEMLCSLPGVRYHDAAG